MENCPKNRFWFFFVENYRVTYLLMIGLIIFGFLAIFQIPKESSPEVNIPVVVVITPLPGSSAETVEELITRPIENQLSGLSDVSRVTSNSEQGLSSVVIEMEPRVSVSEKITEIRNRVDRVRPNLPNEAGNSTIQQISFSDVPIMSLALSGPYPLSELRFYAEELQEELESIKDVYSVNVTGSPNPEIKVRVKLESLYRLNITKDQIIGAISRANLEAPIGTIETGGGVYALRFDANLNSAKEIERIPIDERDGAIITVGDVASVEEGFKNQGTVSRFSSNGLAPQPTVSLRIFKEGGEGNILNISDTVINRIEKLSEQSFPENIEVVVVQNDAEIIRDDLSTLLSSGFLTILIIILTLSLFLGWRQALLASIVVPFSFFITFIVIGAWGLTINFLTLFSLILSLGILVDAAIVVTESISSKYQEGLSISEAVARTINDFQKPLIAGTLTTVFVFLPILFLSGIISEFIRSIPITVSAVLLSALFVALGGITTFAVRFIKRIPQAPNKGIFKVGYYFNSLNKIYDSRLVSFIESRKKSFSLMIVMFFAFIFSLVLPVTGLLPVNMFPSPDSDRVYIDAEAQSGTPLKETLKMIEPIESYLLTDVCVDSFLTVVGQGSQAGSIDLIQASNSNVVGITINLCEEREKTSQEFLSEYRSKFSNLSGLKVKVTQMEEGPQAGDAVSVNVLGSDLSQIEGYVRRVARELEKIEGVSEISNGIKETGGEFVITIEREKAEFYGVSAMQVADVLRTSVSGRVVTDINLNDEDVDVLIINDFNNGFDQIGLASPLSISDIQSLSIFTSKGPVTLDNFLTVELKPGRSSISRRDGDRVITVTASVLSGYNASVITSNLQKRLTEIGAPTGVTVTYGGEAEEIMEAFLDLGRALLLGILLIFALLVWQFKSYAQPFMVLTTVPLSLIGVLVGLTLVGQPLSFPGAIGIVALGGIVVNNAIILIDKINRLYLDDKYSLKQAVVEGAKSRLKPIILTTITTSAGLLPLIFVSQSWAPVSYSIIFGLIFSTVVTLFLVPIMYYRFYVRID